jgi:hypothetical protein
MKLALAMVMSLAVASVPVAGQGPLRRSIEREAVRLTREDADQAHPDDPGWSRVRNLAPATELLVTTEGAVSVHRWFVAADESALTVLRLDQPRLSDLVILALRDVASHHPGVLAHPEGQAVIVGGVQVGADGVFIGNQRVAALNDVVERSVRADIVKISIPWKGRGSAAGAGLGAGI